MKSLKLFLLGVLSLISSYTIADEAKPSSSHQTLMKELKINELKINSLIQAGLPENKDAFVESLSSDIQTRSIDTESPASMALSAAYGYPSHCVMVTPITQGFSYIDGSLCHVGHYLKATLITVFEGINYGCQLTVSNATNQVICINPSYVAEISALGVIFRHEYNDCTVVTGQDQVMFIYQ